MASPLGQASGRAVEALTGDIVVVRGKLYRKVGKGRRATLEPVSVSFHVNPLAIGIGVGALVVGAGVAAWMLGLELRTLSPGERANLEAELAQWEQELAVREEELANAETTWKARWEECGQLPVLDRILECRQNLGSLEEFTAETKARIAVLKENIRGLRAKLRLPLRIENRTRLTDWSIGGLL